MPFIDKPRPPLTSVHVPHHEMGRTAAPAPPADQRRIAMPRRDRPVARRNSSSGG
ncbi:hypothetical protein [Streptosporangium sandarakinum]|uniref:hypothetical protein n=1 Tax=Streptosporangium sandarakinum TaxID=1260955 RepID=UPI0033A17342